MNDKPQLTLQPMVHVRDMAATLAMLEVLGGVLIQESRDGDWAPVSIGGAEIGLLAHPANPDQGEGDVELSFESRTPLEQVEELARSAGVVVAQPTADEGFGRQLQLHTPDGLLLKINEIESDLITQGQPSLCWGRDAVLIGSRRCHSLHPAGQRPFLSRCRSA